MVASQITITLVEVIGEGDLATEKVIVKTWPHPQGKGDYDRDYAIYSVDGDLIVKGSSKWCIINYVTRRLAFGSKVEYPTGEDFCPIVNYQDGLKKIPDFSTDGAKVFNGFAGDSALDHNGHVNNVKYSDFILDAISLKNEKVTSFEINYLNELSLGEYSVVHVKDGDNRLIKGFSGEKESFRAVVTTI